MLEVYGTGSAAGTPAGATFSALTNYDGYGNQKAGASLTPTSNPYGYDGYYTDAESGLCYLNNRYYDPTTQRFTQEDPAMDGNNWYAYSNGDPVNNWDPSGLAVQRVEVFTIKALKWEAQNTLNALRKAYGNTQYYSLHVIDEPASKGDKRSSNDRFKAQWNGMGATDFVVIDTHGDPGSICTYNRSFNYTTDDIQNKLYKKTCKNLILMGCNNGHVGDKNWSLCRGNVAYAFYTRISGTVAASDGTVDVNPISMTCSSIADDYWKDPAAWGAIHIRPAGQTSGYSIDKYYYRGGSNPDRGRQYGWLFYCHGANVPKVYTPLKYSFRIGDLISYMKNERFKG